MLDSYLDIAAHVLSARGLPLTAQQILADARRHGLLPSHMSGATMQKTLQARISEDISCFRSNSRFYRTAQGTYFLREKSNDVSLPSRLVEEYDVVPRRQAGSAARILCTRYYSSQILPYTAELSDLVRIMSSASLFANEEDIPDGVFTVSVFVVIMSNNFVLMHRPSRYSYVRPFSDGLSMGFHRYVDEFDQDLLDDDGVGINRAAVRACVNRIDFVELGIDDRRIIDLFSIRGVIVDPIWKRLGIVISLAMPKASQGQISIKRRLDSKSVGWRELAAIDTNDLDMWSVLCRAKFALTSANENH